mmetsp:Transcript_35590/g.84480  ORF Transcript_35590/g.84480 Transcript_35590/m.84480 type:complete len:456 (-) Transcript_35590:1465-2832(-)
MVQELLLSAPLHDGGDAADEVCSLLAHLGALVVQPPLQRPADLGQVGFDALAEGVDDRRYAVQHDLGVLALLLLEGVQDAVDHLLLEARVDVRGAQVRDHLLNRLHHHLAVRLRLIFQPVHQTRDDFSAAHLVGEFDGSVDELAVVAPVERHTPDPQVLEELREDLRTDIGGVDTLGTHALLHHLHDNLLHLLVGGLELADEDGHDLFGVEAAVLRLHERDDEPHRLEEGGEDFAVVRAGTDPQRLQHGVEGLDAVGGSGLRERRQRQRRDRPHLLLLVSEAVLHDLHHVFEVREDGAAHEDGDLLDDLDACVARLPALLGLTHRLEEGKQGRNSERGGDYGEGARSSVAHVLVEVVNVRAHRRNHGREPSGLREIRDDLPSLHACVVVLVDEQRLDHHQDLMHVRPHQIVEFVEHAVNDFDQQMALLILERRRHEQGQNLVEKRPRSELARLVR